MDNLNKRDFEQAILIYTNNEDKRIKFIVKEFNISLLICQ